MKASNLVALANIIETNASDYAIFSIADCAVYGLTVVLERVDSGHDHPPVQLTSAVNAS